MGGIGSGRRGGKATIEGRRCEVLPMSFVRRNSLGAVEKITMRYERPATRFWADVEADFTSADPHVLLRHLPRTDRHGFACVEYKVDLVTTPAPLGGKRWWFKCPVTGVRVGKLYLPEGEERFLSRQAYGLRYASQRITGEQAPERRRKSKKAASEEE